MRLIIQPNYDLLSEWAANYVAHRINEFAPKEGTFQRSRSFVS